MRLIHRSSMVGGVCGGGRALRRVDSSPRPSLCKSDAMKKKRSKRSRIKAVLLELKVAAKARDKDGLLQILVTGHRASRGGYNVGATAAAGTSTERSVASMGAERRAALWRQGGLADAAAKTGGGPLLEVGRPAATGGARGRGRRCASWVLAATLVIALACVVSIGTAPAICCCTCAADAAHKSIRLTLAPPSAAEEAPTVAALQNQ
uniref:Uncharacterized protein n=1 Tax=Avena sativa TaxID=4498 RepID=A0ACD5XI34_AVESA